MQKISPIIQVAELIKLKAEQYILIDASAGSKSRFDEKHLAGALYIDLDTDLAEIKDFAIGGRHPLPNLNHFAETLGKFGMTRMAVMQLLVSGGC